MRVLFTSLRNTSHFLPLVPFIEACRRRGHEVAVAAPADLGERVAATGAGFHPFGHPGDAGLAPLWKRMRDAPREEANRLAIGELFAGVLARTALPGLLETLERWQPAIVIRESQEYAAVVAAEKLRIHHAHVAITARSTEAGLVPLAAPSVDALGQSLGLPTDPSGERIRREAALTLLPACMEDPKLESTPALRFRSERKPASPLPAWWGESQARFVYATLGTVTGGMDQMRSAYRVVLESVRDLPVNVLLTIGSDLPLQELGEVPRNVHVERFVPQDEILPHARAVLCHGGSGTVVGALAAGVPMVVVPMFADQMNNAERVAAIGAGLALPRCTDSPDELRRALSKVLASDDFRQAAQGAAQEIANLPAIDDAALELERLTRAGQS